MKCRKLGNTGLIVSEVGLGNMQFGGKMNMGNLAQEETTRIVRLALDRGINSFNTAEDSRSKVLYPERYAAGGSWKDLARSPVVGLSSAC